MKDSPYSEIICKRFCRYYKEGKEELQCGGYSFLKAHLTPAELASMLKASDKEATETAGKDPGLLESICRGCDFVVDGCDFADNRSGPPCGGYTIVRILSTRV